MMKKSALLAFVLSALPHKSWTWTFPNAQMSEIDSQRYDRKGFNSRLLPTILVSPCDSFVLGSNTGGRSNAADWIRTAYHDMATHNATAGTGGLDASIQFELDRDENVGDGFLNTLGVITGQANRYMGLADQIALAAIIAVEECGGPQIDFRGGRVDASQADSPGVPEPQQSLEAHIAAFARQGFTQTEMISLVSCGHTFGGVQNTAFPTIVPPSSDPNDTEGDVLFDTTGAHFDNNIATEYLSGTTQNPLVVGQNDTTNSDKRIFGSDGNITMNTFADPQVYASTCATLYSKMIHTVASGIQLTDVVDPISVKPDQLQLTYMGDGTLQLSGLVRFWGLAENSSRTVTLTFTDRLGTACQSSPSNNDGCAFLIAHDSSMVSTFTPTNTPSVWYRISNSPATTSSNAFISINETTSIGKFSFEIDEGDGSPVKVEDQNGLGFAVSDLVMIANPTCMGNNAINFSIAVRKGVSPTRVYVEEDVLNTATNVFTSIQTFDASPPSTPNSTGNYDIWTLSVPNSDWPNGRWNVAADIDGQTIRTFYLTSAFEFC